eukprot:gene25751-31099_t
MMSTCELYFLCLVLLIFIDVAILTTPTPSPTLEPKHLVEYHAHNYRWAYPHLAHSGLRANNTSITIVEVGSRDVLDANNLAYHFNAQVYAFEGNPDNFPRMALYNVDPRVEVVRKAVTSKDGEVAFYPYNLTLYRNAGAGGLYVVDFEHRDPRDKDYKRPPVQYKVNVPSIRLDTFMREKGLKKIDLLCMDVQESELEVLLSAGQRLQDIHYLVSEVSTYSTYIGGNNYTALHAHLEEQGFEFMAYHLSGRRESHTHFPAEAMKRRQELDVLYRNNRWGH